MGVLFTLTQNIKSVITQALDDLITELGKDCRLVFPPKMVACNNCFTGPQGNVWKTGGPAFFNVGSVCPLCGGKNRIAQEQSRTVRMLCAVTPKDFYVPLIKNINVELPQGLIQTKFYLTDLPDVMKCDHMIFETAIEGLVRLKFRQFREVIDPSNIIQGRYGVMTWQRAG